MLHTQLRASILNGDEPAIPCTTDLFWHAEDPTCITWVFAVEGQETVSWMHSRLLLTDALTSYQPQGEGDVVFQCKGKELWMTINGDDFSAVLYMGREQVDSLIEGTIRVVAPGSEQETGIIQDALAGLTWDFFTEVA